MAFVAGFEYDIFISYTHKDDFPVGGYYCVHDTTLRPLFAPPALEETQFDQVIRWAEAHARRRPGADLWPMGGGDAAIRDQ